MPAVNRRSFRSRPRSTSDVPGEFPRPGGRSSNTSAFPFFTISYASEGVIAAVGWTGQWSASLERSPSGPARFRVGMERTHLVLHAGERIRTPARLAHDMERRPSGGPQSVSPADIVSVRAAAGRQARTPAHRLAVLRSLQCDPAGMGDRSGPDQRDQVRTRRGLRHSLARCRVVPGRLSRWRWQLDAKPVAFPRGLAQVGEACHRGTCDSCSGSSRSALPPGRRLRPEHPEFVFGGSKGGLFRLDDPAARRWLGDLLSKRITEYGIDIYRNDFNMDPLPFWRGNDPPDRQGMTEIRYVEGLYELWDRLRAEHPGLMIDNCSSGGRRIDLETCMRSVPLWRSDTSCSPGHPEWNQVQTCGLGLYVPLHTACGWVPTAYDFRSSATAGAISQWDFLNPEFPQGTGTRHPRGSEGEPEVLVRRFYPLTACSLAHDQFVAYQFHRPDLGRRAGAGLPPKRLQPPGTRTGAERHRPESDLRRRDD